MKECLTEPALTPVKDTDPFENWLDSTIGSDVFYRIMHNKHAASLDRSASHFDTLEDVQQKALIWLWERWQLDPDFEQLTQQATGESHTAGVITKTAIQRARCMYAKRRREGRENQVDFFYADGHERFIPYHDRPVAHTDQHTDVQGAIEVVVQRMIADLTHYRTSGQLNQRYAAIPIEHITRTIIEGYMYHYTDRYSQTGTFRKFCAARGVSKNQIARWRPQIMAYLREELSAYAPILPVKSFPPIEAASPPPKLIPREVILYQAPPGLFAVQHRFAPPTDYAENV